MKNKIIISYLFMELGVFKICLILGLVGLVKTSDVKGSQYCDFYNESMCDGEFKEGCTEPEQCRPHDPDKRNHCYVLWQYDNVTSKPIVKLKGCFADSKDCYDKTNCVEKTADPKNQHFFCCCNGNMCNKNFTWNPEPIKPIPILTEEPKPALNLQQKFMIFALSAAIPVLIFFAGLAFFYLRRRNIKKLSASELGMQPKPSQNQENYPIQLLEIKARGRFGAVWKAQLENEIVAVKVFPIEDKYSWQSEQEIFKLASMDHQNILRFIGVENHTDKYKPEFWLITAYHEKGSLYDYLKANVISWSEMCRVAESMARGLTHLHEEIPGHKPAIAHRDFKSKNILLKSDMTACLADFGLALTFNNGKPQGDTHSQVGTHRYMAPEVLEGAINFTPESFFRIDMYACGLVLWELASRCIIQDSPIGEYKLPFEEEVGLHPTLEIMQESVVHKKERPLILDTWRKHSGLQEICNTMEDCWDDDAEARLSASGVAVRVSKASGSSPE